MDTSHADRRCPQCGAALIGDAPLGACPACLLTMAVEPASQLTDQVSDGFTDAVSSGAYAHEPARFSDGAALGSYRIVRMLGRGGMGEVYEAVGADGRSVALKVLRERLQSESDRARFLREGVLAASVADPHCIYVFGSEEIDDVPVIAMELAPQGTLKQAIGQFGPRTPIRAVQEILQVVAGLEAAADAGILHRDVKPSNCFIDADGGIKVGDFGLSVSLNAGDADIVWKPTFQGTPEFAAPEQLRGEPLDVRADIYSVGATLFYLLTGSSPFRERNVAKLIELKTAARIPSPRDLLPDITEGLAKLVQRCLSPDPNRRPQTHADLRRLLRPFVVEAGQPATLVRRVVAALVDSWAWTLVTFPLAAMGRTTQDGRGLRARLLVETLMMIFIVLCERFFGATPGKFVCGLRVVGEDGRWPTFVRALERWGLSLGLVAVGLIFEITGVTDSQVQPQWWGLALLAYWVISIVVAQSRADHAMLHDIWTRTRVIRWHPKTVDTVDEHADREPTQSLVTTPIHVDRVGPFQVLGRIRTIAGGDVLLGRDPRLCRFVWIHRRSASTEPLPAARRHLTQLTRLRWLAGDDTWDAFEAPDGRAFHTVCRYPQEWQRVRSWLVDLSRDLEAAEATAVIPTLAVDALWVLGDGRIMLLDFTAPGAASGSEVADTSAPQFLIRVAAAANSRHAAPHSFAVVLKALAEPWVNIRQAAAMLRQLAHEPATLNRWRRALPILVCAMPAIIAVTSSLLSEAEVRSRYDRPDAQLTAVLDQIVSLKGLKSQPETANLLYGYVAESFRAELAANPNFWTSPRGRAFSKYRKAIENLHWYQPTSTDLALTARAAAGDWFLDQRRRDLQPWESEFRRSMTVRETAALQPLMIIALFVALFSLLGSPLLFRLTGHALLDAEGLDARIGRRFVRAVVTWSPLFLIRTGAPVLVPIALLAVGAIYAIVFPERAIQDRIAGTYVAPR